MIASLLILPPLAAVAVWAFFRFAPAHPNPRAVRRFNLFSLAVAFLLAGAWSIRTYLIMTPTVEAAWWPVISVVGALVIAPLVLAVAAMVRHLIVFRRSTETG